jgi:hypothetical protein
MPMVTIGFNYDINALGAKHEDSTDELAAAFEALFKAESGVSLISVAKSFIPFLRNIVGSFSPLPIYNNIIPSQSPPRLRGPCAIRRRL